ncbi:MAG: strawberry notch family protein [Bacteroidota bacterium]|nr:strawberry notch family protein [Bacteroidota bacterium]
MRAAKPLAENHKKFVDMVFEDISKGVTRNKLYYERIATQLEITDKNLVKELTELAIVKRARKLAHVEYLTDRQRFDEIVKLYEKQVNLSHRTSQSVMLQQYSTPAPISYLAGLFAGAYSSISVFEPCAGNGLLAIAAREKYTTVNEIDPVRKRHLESEWYKEVLSHDAEKPFVGFEKKFESVLTNPPFGRLDEAINFGTFGIKTLEHMMVINALNCMSDRGRAAVIVGGHAKYDEQGRVRKGANRIFLNYLYHHYDVLDVINIDGHKLYSRQGTAFDVRMILIDGRKAEPKGNAPLYDKKQEAPIKDFDSLFRRVYEAHDESRKTYEMARQEFIEIRKEIDRLVPPKNGDWSERIKKYQEEHLQLIKLCANDGYHIEEFIQKEYPDISFQNIFQHITEEEIGIDPEKEARELIERLTEELKKENPDSDLSGAKKQKSFRITIRQTDFPFKKWKLIDQHPSKEKAQSFADCLVLDMLLRWEPSVKAKVESVEEVTESDLKGIDREQLYLMKFVQENPPMKEYAAYGKFFSLKQAQRFAQNIAVSFLNYQPPLDIRVESVRPWIEGFQLNGLGAPYNPTSESCIVLDTVVPDSMSYETHEALAKVSEAVGGDVDEFVRNRLGYRSKFELCKALAAEQIDAVALAIYNIEARGQGMIIGDQTGIGKGRIAAAMIRYAVKRGHKPIFLTEKPNLFTDLYRDLKAIGSPHLVPFIFNAKDIKSNILDEHGNKVYSALDLKEQDLIFESGSLPSVYDFVMATYTQFNSPNKPKKRNFLDSLAENNILILDEAHNASGSGNTGQYMQDVIALSKGVLFLSATFAKRPDNMPLYALKTVLREANMDKYELVLAIKKGGVALQEIIASELVKEGQMLRRERSFEGVEVNYITLHEMEAQHRAISDSITEILRDIILFQKGYITTKIDQIDKGLAKEQKQAQVREGTQRAGADNLPYFSKVFHVINQMLFAIKAEAVADRAIMRLKEGKKPVIAFSSTMGAFIEGIENTEGNEAVEGDIINADFAEVLRRGLEGVNRYTEVDIDGKSVHKELSIKELGRGADLAYQRIINKIETISTGITISPIDVIVQKIREAGYSVAEVTGRKYELELLSEESIYGLGKPETPGKFPVNIQDMIKHSGRFGPGKQLLARVKVRKRMVTNEAFRKFNNNEIDVLLINQSGSTGASAHAIPTDKVPLEQIKQRVMIVLQAELDISTEVQKRGRINRTGQIYKPIYDYVTSAIPAEQRLMMMLQSKLKSLDANTTSNQKQSKTILDVPDFLNKYGDHLVEAYLEDNPEINELLDKPLETESYTVQEPAMKVSGRVAVLSTQLQQEFYEEMTSRYNDYVEYLKQSGEYDLEVERLELKAKTINADPIIMGKGGSSTFGTNSVLEEVDVDVLRKPMRFDEVQSNINQALGGKDAKQIQAQILQQYIDSDTKHITDIAAIEKNYDEILKELPNAKWLKKVLDTDGEDEYQGQLKEEHDKYVKQREEKIENIFKKHADLRDYLERIFKFFYIGRTVNFIHLDSEGKIADKHNAIFLGFVIDLRKKNPFILSNIKLRFAIASGLRYFVVPASDRMSVSATVGESSNGEVAPDGLKDYWDIAISTKMKNRERRHIVTGNILQGLGKFVNGRLISYTTEAGEEKKGNFMPENWSEENENAEMEITVPASKVLPLIKSLGEGHEMVIGRNISIFRHAGKFRLIAPASKSAGGEVYLNKAILQLVEGNNFNKVSNTMVAIFDQNVLAELLNVMEREIGTSVTVSQTQFQYIKEYFPEVLVVNNFPKLELLPEIPQTNNTDDDLLAEAEALMLIQALEMEMLQMELTDKNQ